MAVSPLSFKAMVLEMYCHQLLAGFHVPASSHGGGADLDYPQKGEENDSLAPKTL
jgi:hypothetical protein